MRILAAAVFVLAAVAVVDADMTVAAAVHFVELREGFVDHPYRDQAGLWTIGFGRRIDNGRHPPVTRDEEEAWLFDRVDAILDQVRSDITVAGMNQDQHVALASLCYNIGWGACERSELFRMINAGEPVGEIIREWLSWDHIHRNGERIVSRGLSRRRAQEVGLYFFGTSDLQ